MPAKRSIVQVYLTRVIFLAMFPSVVLGYLWVSEKYQHFEDQAQDWRQSYISTRKRMLQQEVERTLSFIEFKRSQVERRLNDNLKQRVDGAVQLIDGIYQYNQSLLSRQQITAQVLAVLETMRPSDGSGPYSVVTLDGRVLHRAYDSPEFETQLAAALSAQQGKAAAVYIEYDENEEQGAQHILVYGRYYAPLNIVVGASDRPERVMTEVKNEVIERLSSIDYDRDKAVLFLMADDGRVLLRPSDFLGAGAVMHRDTRPVSHDEFVALHRRAADSAEGGFIDYRWREQNSESGSPAVNFVRGYQPWGWMVGAGFYLNTLEQSIAESRQVLEHQVAISIIKIVAVLSGLMAIVVFSALRLSRITRRSFERFSDFFHDASRHSAVIDQDKLPYQEYAKLAADANEMIAQRDSYEKALHNSERQFELALDFSGSYVWQFDAKTNRVIFGEGFLAALGYDDDYRVGVSQERLIELCHPEDVDRVSQGLRIDSGQNVASIEYRLRDKDGVYHWFLSRGGIAGGGDSEREQALGIVTEISEQKHLQAQLYEARVIADDANHAKSLFLSSMSHELRTPLNGVLGHVQILLQQQGFDREQRRQLEQINDCGLHLLGLIDDVLNLSKIDSGRVDCNYQQVLVRELLQDVSDRMRQKAILKGLACSVQIGDSVPELVVVDAFKVKQVLVNLMTNAIEFTQSGFVDLSVATDGAEHLVFAVTDSSEGVNEQYNESVLGVFSQSDNSGLGLAICRRLAEAMNGRLSFKREANRGNVFSLYLPLTTSHLEGVSHLPALPVTKPAPTLAKPATPSFDVTPDVRAALFEAASEGDVEKFRAYLSQACQQGGEPAGWVNELQRCVDNFDLDAAAQLLNNMDAKER